MSAAGDITATAQNFYGVGSISLWADVALDILSGLVLLSYDGNDQDGLVPIGMPRPIIGGRYLGEVDRERGVVEKPQISFENIPVVGSTIPRRVRIKEESATVSASLIF